MEHHLQLLRRILLGCCFPCLVPVLAADSPPLRYDFDPEESRMEVFVPRAGFLSVLGHDHTIAVREFEGHLEFQEEDPQGAEIHFQVPVKSMMVMDEGVGENTREKIGKEMRGKAVLDQEAHPVISFHATEVFVQDSGQWQVKGLLNVAGVEKPVAFPAQVEFPGDNTVRASGTVSLKPEIFGIEPVKALGGAVRTSRSIEIRFNVTGKLREGEGL